MEEQSISRLIEEYEKNKEIEKIISVRLEKASGEGEGYTSLVQRIRLKIKLKNGKMSERSYIMKSSPGEGSIERTFIETYDLMRTEIQVYEEILKNMEELIDEKRDEKMKIWCDLIRYEGKEKIILEDLQPSGYKMINRLDCLDYEHLIVAVSSLARFHAISKVYFSKNKEKIDSFRKCLLFEDDSLLNMCTTGGLVILSKVMKESWGPEWSDMSSRILKASKVLKETLINNIISYKKEEMDVFNHGDLWCCNIMFKYDDFRNTPIHAKLIDFQLPHYNSLAWDLTFVLYTSVRPHLRRKHLHSALNAYFDVFTKTLDFYGFDGPRLSRQDFDDEMDRFRYVGMLILCSSYVITISKEPTLTLEPFLQNNAMSCFFPEPFKNEKYKKDIEDDLKEFVKDGLL